MKSKLAFLWHRSGDLAHIHWVWTVAIPAITLGWGLFTQQPWRTLFLETASALVVAIMLIAWMVYRLARAARPAITPTEVRPTVPDPPPAFDLSDNAKAALNRTQIYGVPHGLVKAGGNSSFTVTEGVFVSEATFNPLPPDGSYTNKTNDQLRAAVIPLARDLGALEAEYDKASSAAFLHGSLARDWNAVWAPFQKRFDNEFQPICRPLAAEIMRRIGPMVRNASVPLTIRAGYDAIARQPSGVRPYESAAMFLEHIASRLPR